MCVRDSLARLRIGRHPLPRAGWALGQVPLVAEERLEVAVVPLDRGRRPRALEAAGDGVPALARAVGALPAQTHLLQGCGLRLRADVGSVPSTVGLAEGVSASDQGDGLLVVHGHPAERLADVTCGCQRAGLAVGPLGIHVDETHLDSSQRVVQLAFPAVALVLEPLGLIAPVDLLGLPDILAAAAEAERLEAHRLQRAVAGQDEEIGPGDLAPVLLLDRPEEPAGLVEVGVVRPAVQGREPLLAGSCAAATVTDAVGARTVPRHPDEQRAVVTPICRPPLLRGRHQGLDVVLHGVEVEGLELLGVVELSAHGAGRGRILVQDVDVQLVGPPVTVRHPCRAVGHRALALVLHCVLSFGFCLVVSHGIPSGSGWVRWVGLAHCLRWSTRHTAPST